MSLISNLRFILNHPLNRKSKMQAFLRLLKWQINNLINPYPIIYPFTDKCRLIVKKGMSGATGNLYCGLHDYSDMFFLLHFLRKNDLFIDVGANIGSYTILAGAHVECDVISIEPVPTTFISLMNNISINCVQQKVKVLNIALGSSNGNIKFSRTQDTTNHVATNIDIDTIIVNMSTLDAILDKRVPALLKIDVEGFETEVLNGASSALESKGLKAIIIELNGSGARYNYDESLIHTKLVDLGFTPCFYNPTERTLTELTTFGIHNTIYVRDIDYVSGRLKTAEKVKILQKLV